jgi:hypothetical protein
MSLEFAMEADSVMKICISTFLQAHNASPRGTLNSSVSHNCFAAQWFKSSLFLFQSSRLEVVSAASCRQATRRSIPIVIMALVMLSLASHAIASLTTDYTYDELNRLTGSARNDGTPMVLYHYDEVSNIKWIATQGSPDSDGDDIPNFVDPDDDNDGIPDIAEITAGLNPLLAADANGDLDGDGINNVDEYALGSDINHFHGDIDSDGDLDLGDIVILKRIIFEEVAATQEQGESGHGDVNIDGALDVGDLVLLRRFYFGN